MQSHCYPCDLRGVGKREFFQADEQSFDGRRAVSVVLPLLPCFIVSEARLCNGPMLLAVLGWPHFSGAENISVSWLVRMGLCLCRCCGFPCQPQGCSVGPPAPPSSAQPCSCLPTAPGCSAHCSSLRAGKNPCTSRFPHCHRTGMCFLKHLGTLCPPLRLGNMVLCIFHLGLLGQHLPAAATGAVGFGNWSCHFPTLDVFNNWLQQWVFNSLASISRPAV